jgi:hypothetical protein
VLLSFGAAQSKFITGLVGEQWKGLSGSEDLPGVDDLLGSFRWYNALCVNQQDLQERSQQVKRMAEIYTKATRVIAWLGTASETTTIARKCFDEIASHIDVDWARLEMQAHSVTVVTPIATLVAQIPTLGIHVIYVGQIEKNPRLLKKLSA